MSDAGSRRLFSIAEQLFPGGVNSPVRAFKGVGGIPKTLVRGAGSRVYDADGCEYIDYVGSWGPLILGHAHEAVVEAIERAARDGTSFGAPNPYETALAERIQAAMPSIERMRFVSSGTEACMSAVRLARAYTTRDHIVKFDGCYHGHADSMLVSAGSGALTLGVPSSAGVPAALAALTIVLPYNDIEALEHCFAKNGDRIACVIAEPIAANMGLVRPKPKFLQSIIETAHRHGTLVIFDEVITGFRVALGGAQSLFSLTPDLTCLGKIVGAGLPVGAFGGKAEIMRRLAPQGDVYQAGTLSGNPLAMAAGAAQLDVLAQPGIYTKLDEQAARLEQGLRAVITRHKIDLEIDRVGSIFGLFFTRGKVENLADVKRADAKRYASFFHQLLDRGVYLAPSAFEVGFVSTAHSKADIDDTIEAMNASLAAVSAHGRV